MVDRHRTNKIVIEQASTTEMDALSPAAAFARSLKTYDDVTFGEDKKKQTRLAVVNFDEGRFIASCSPSSPTYNADLCNYDEITSELFTTGEVWVSRDLVHKALTLIADMHGWTVKMQKEYIVCNRYGKPNEGRKFVHGDLRAGCTLRLVLKALVKVSYIPGSSQNRLIDGVLKKSTLSYRNQWDKPVEISKGTCTTHGGQCHPGRQNKVATAKRAGVYVEKMPNNALFSLCNILERTGKLSASVIKETIEPVWPKAKKNITKHDVFNLRVKVMRLMPTFRKSNGEYEEFKKVVNASELLRGIDNEESINDDEAYELAQSLWLEVASTASKNKEEAIFSFIEYLALIKSRAKGFTYKLAEGRVKGGRKKKLLGVLWMTATMRRNFELFGCYICMDMMKRGLNTLLWPYCAVTMFDETNQMCLACEGILCGERDDMYQFVADFLGESAPGRPLADVNIVSGDGLFDQDMVIELGFVNAKFFTDQWHLLDSGLSKKFGKSGYELLKGHLVRMVKADSEQEFEDTLQAARNLLQSQLNRNGQLESDLEEFASLRKTYASYCHAQVPGNRGYHGNAISESNHSSVLAYLNDGNKNGNNFCGNLLTLIRELLKRQQNHVTKANERLFGMTQKMRVERAGLVGQPATHETIDLLKAAAVLNLPSYERYKSRRQRAFKNYRLDPSHVNQETQQTCHAVFSTQYPDAPPRLFADMNSRCGCQERLAEEDMCCHEILSKGGFNENYFLPRHMARESVSGSLEGWTEPVAEEQSKLDDILGYEMEQIAPTSKMDGIIGSADGDEMMAYDTMMTDADESSRHATDQVPPQLASPPPGYMPERGGKVAPLGKKRVQNVLANVTAGYSNMGVERKFAVSSLVMQLEELLLVDSTQSRVVETRGGLAVQVPNQACLAAQTKKRMMPVHEIQVKKMQKSLQSQGERQLLSVNDDYDIVVNGKQKKSCGFCGSKNHQITTCDNRADMRMRGHEHVLSSKFQMNQIALRQRITNMPIGVAGKGSSLLSSVGKEYENSNFIIHKASLLSGGTLGCMDDMIFCISFIGKLGTVIDGSLTKEVWITGRLMNSLTTHKIVKSKYVYDETIGRVGNGMEGSAVRSTAIAI